MEVRAEGDGDVEDVNMVAPTGEAAGGGAPHKRPTRTQPPSSLSREASVEMTSDNDNASSVPNDNESAVHSQNRSDDSSSTSTTAVSRASDASSAKPAAPPLKEQVEIIARLCQEPSSEHSVGYVVSKQWLQDAEDRGSGLKKGNLDEVQPPIDTRELVKPVDASWDGLKDERGERFIPLKPGLVVPTDIEIIPEEAWTKIVAWHGLAAGAPAIKRYCHNTATGVGSENMSFELFPPVFTVMKLPDPTTTEATFSVSERSKPPAKLLATRSAELSGFVKRAKSVAFISASDEVRLWKVIGTLADASQQPGMITPAQSRSNSPAPATLPVNLANKLVVDPKQFAELENGTKRELVDATGFRPDGSPVTLDAAGLGQEGIIVLDPQISGPAGGEYVSDSLTSIIKVRLLDDKSKSAVSSGRTSPAPLGVQTRGRAQRIGKTRGTSGLVNLGNTCYMNSALQCVKSVEELTKYFLDERYKKELNPSNPLAHNGEVAKEYAKLLKQMFAENGTAFSPRQFKSTIGKYGASFSGYGQQDSQEFLLFLLDGLQEDLNRIYKKPYIEKPDSTDAMVYDNAALQAFADRNWEIYKARNDSVITDLFAGMYKSTLTCPVCHKVSIIFDPFNNLTLQLPIESTWSRKIIFHPLYLPAIEIDVDIDRNATFAALKEWISGKVVVDPKRIVLSEVYQSRFYKMFPDGNTIAEERIQNQDVIVAFELDEIPSNYPDPRPRNARGFSHNLSDDTGDAADASSDLAKQLLVPIFHRVPKEGASHRGDTWTMFGNPSYVVLSEEDAKDEEQIMKKVLARVATMTTKDILEQAESDEESDTVLMSAEDGDSSDSRVKAQSIQDEDGMVDVSMQDAEAPRKSFPPPPRLKRSLPAPLDPDRDLPSQLTRLFEMKVFGRDEFIPTAWNKLGNNDPNIIPFSNRKPQPPKRPSPTSKKDKLKRRIANGGSDTESSDDELAAPQRPASDVDSSEDEALPSVEQLNATRTDRFGNDLAPEPEYPTEPVPLVRLGEGIVCDWDPQQYEALFGEEPGSENEMRGAPTWNMPRVVFPDPDMVRKRELRAVRKRNGVTLEDCLEESDKKEVLSEADAWFCPRCKDFRRASKTFELWKVPDILVIHFKRFAAQGRLRDKLDLMVEFPLEGLDLSKRVADHEGKELIYDLVAVDNHYGGLGGGHYTAYARSFNDGHWYDYNDATSTKQADPQRVVSSSAYLLFYRRRSDKPLGGPFFESPPPDTAPSSTANSRTHSPAGEGQRLGDSSRIGSSSASRAAGAGRPAGGVGPTNHGARAADAAITEESVHDIAEGETELLPPYSTLDPNADVAMESMELDEADPHPYGPVVTWNGFASIPRDGGFSHNDDEISTRGAVGANDPDEVSSTRAENDADGDDRSMRSHPGSETEWMRPGTPDEGVLPSITVDAPRTREGSEGEEPARKMREVSHEG